MVRSTRSGDIGWVGPKSYSVRLGSKTTVAGPEHSSMGATYLYARAVPMTLFSQWWAA